MLGRIVSPTVLCLTHSPSSPHTVLGLRLRASNALGIQLGGRGDNRRRLELRHLAVHVLPDDGSPSSRVAMVVLVPRTKTRQKPELTACFRHVHPELCAHGACSLFMWVRLDILVRVWWCFLDVTGVAWNDCRVEGVRIAALC